MAKIKNLVTGEIIEVHRTVDHPDSSYGIPVWVDKDGNSYGQDNGILPCAFGYEIVEDTIEDEDTMYRLLRNSGNIVDFDTNANTVNTD